MSWLGDGDRWLSPLPLSHVAGLMIFMRSVIAITTAVIARFEAGATAEASPATSISSRSSRRCSPDHRQAATAGVGGGARFPFESSEHGSAGTRRRDAGRGRRRAAPEDTGPLTPREREILQLVAEGLTHPEIADQLLLSLHTVHRHVANIRTKLRSPSRAAAASERDLI